MKNESAIQSQFGGAPLLKLTSTCASKYVWNRKAGFVESKPERPPSPKMVCGQVTLEPVVSNVPLSWVPPCTSFAFAGFTDRLWNCSVWSPLFRLVYDVGARDKSCLQRLSAGSIRLRPSQRLEMSVNVPSDRIRPPSEPSKYWFGLFGFTANACWSGCRPTCDASVPSVPSGRSAASVSSVNVLPPSVDRRTARAFESW